MTILKLIDPTNPILRKTADRVGLPGMFLEEVIGSLYATMYENQGVGLAHTQVGVNQQLAVIDVEGEKLTLINPEIIEKSEKMVISVEACLSCPGVTANVKRHKEITIRNFTVQGEEQIIKLTGQAATVAQHEIDHLRGVLITDHARGNE